MNRLLGISLLVALTGAWTAPLGAQDKKGTNTAPADAAGKATPSADADAVQRLSLAYGLIHYGRKNKVPEALITAARILADTSTVDLKDKPARGDAPKGEKTADKPKAEVDNSPKALLEEAKTLSGQNESVVKLANAVEIKRGAVGGPKRTTEVVKGLDTDVYRIAFRGDEIAKVAISGDGDTRLDLYIYDENGNLITSQVGPGDDALASWVPRWAGTFTIKVVNRGRIANRYVIATN